MSDYEEFKYGAAQKVRDTRRKGLSQFLEEEPTPTLIGLGGYLRSGKDAVGDYLYSDYGFTKMGMSDALHEDMLKLNPWIPTNAVELGDMAQGTLTRYGELVAQVGYVQAKLNPEVRRLLQVLGTEVGRNHDEDIWVKAAEKKIIALRAEGKPVVLTAVRFPNEVEMIERLGGITMWIDRGPEYWPSPNAHASETSVGIADFEVTIPNRATLEELYSTVDTALGYITLKTAHNGV